jgi:glyoxylase-like metal-dependent hydrolase (beta-lactamase superfamily II)
VRLPTLLSVTTATLIAAAPLLGDGGYEIREVADGVYAALQPSAGRFNESNSAIIVNDRDVIVVDSQSSAAQVRELVAEIRKLTDKPVRYLVNTHFHSDHTQGNEIYREAFPGVEIIGHPTLLEDVPRRAGAYLEEQIATYDAAIAEAEATLGRGEGPADLADRLARGREHVALLRAIALVPPTLTVDDRLVLYRGERRVEILHFRAHTRGDLVVYLPREKVLVTGDLLDDLPYGGHGYPSSWVATLDALERLDFERVISGHGRVQEGKEHLARVRALLASVIAQAAAAVAEGKSLEETQASVDLSALRPGFVAEGDEAAARAFDEFMPALVERAYLEARGEIE